MTYFDEVQNEVKRGLEGKNSSVPMGFDRLNKYVSIKKRIYTLVFGATGSGKTAIVHEAFILNPFEWWYKNRYHTRVTLKIPLFSMERSKVYTISKWISRKIFIDHGIHVPIARMLGWWETKMTKDEHDLFLSTKDYINSLSEVVDIIEGAQNPTAIYMYLKRYAEANGKVEQVDEFHRVYVPNRENEMVIPIVDHLGLTKVEKGGTKKEAIDKLSEYLQNVRDFYGYSPVAVSQINRDISNPIYQKMDSIEPNLDQVKESGRPCEDSDCVISLFQPSRYKTNDPSYSVGKFIDPINGGDYFRKVKILKNTYGESDIGIGMGFLGFAGMFKELPKKADMEDFDYNQLFNGKYFR